MRSDHCDRQPRRITGLLRGTASKSVGAILANDAIEQDDAPLGHQRFWLEYKTVMLLQELLLTAAVDQTISFPVSRALPERAQSAEIPVCVHQEDLDLMMGNANLLGFQQFVQRTTPSTLNAFQMIEVAQPHHQINVRALMPHGNVLSTILAKSRNLLLQWHGNRSEKYNLMHLRKFGQFVRHNLSRSAELLLAFQQAAVRLAHVLFGRLLGHTYVVLRQPASAFCLRPVHFAVFGHIDTKLNSVRTIASAIPYRLTCMKKTLSGLQCKTTAISRQVV